MTVAAIQSGSIIAGPTLPEAVEVLVVTPFGEASKVIGKGLRSGKIYDTVFSPAQLSQLTVSAESEPFDGDARLFRLGIEAQRLGLAYDASGDRGRARWATRRAIALERSARSRD